jgi:hypothetical protein
MSNKGQFSSDRQPSDRTKRGPSKRTLLLNAVHKQCRDDLGQPFATPAEAEVAFMEKLVKRAMTIIDPASGQLLKEVLARLHPVDKATMPAISFDFREDGNAAEKIEDVQKAVAAGILPVDMGNTMVNMIVAGIKVFEVTELADRLARIEEMLAKVDGD